MVSLCRTQAREGRLQQLGEGPNGNEMAVDATAGGARLAVENTGAVSRKEDREVVGPVADTRERRGDSGP